MAKLVKLGDITQVDEIARFEPASVIHRLIATGEEVPEGQLDPETGAPLTEAVQTYRTYSLRELAATERENKKGEEITSDTHRWELVTDHRAGTSEENAEAALAEALQIAEGA